jgi:hypothetical protein
LVAVAVAVYAQTHLQATVVTAVAVLSFCVTQQHQAQLLSAQV